MSEEPQVHQSFGSVLLSVLITLIIVGCAGFVFYSITKQQQPQQDAIQEKLQELKAEVDNNKELKEKIQELESKISTLENGTIEDTEETNDINTENWETTKNEFFNIEISYPQEYKLCVNDECDNSVKDIEADYWKITDPNSEQNEYLMIYPRINKLDQLAIEFGQKMFLANTQEENTIQGSDAIGVFNEQLSYQFDVNGKFIEPGVTLDENYYLTYDPNAETTEFELNEPYRIIYFDYDGFIYQIIYPTENPVFEKILENIQLTEVETITEPTENQ